MKKIKKLIVITLSVFFIYNCDSHPRFKEEISFKIEPNSLDIVSINIKEERKIEPKLTITIEE